MQKTGKPHRSIRRVAGIIFLFFVLPILACNYPQPVQETITVEQARQTLVATLFANQPPPGFPTPSQPLPPEPGTPAPFPGLKTATPAETAVVLASPTPLPANGGIPPIAYTALSGDTLEGVAGRFGVDPELIISPSGPVPSLGLIPPGYPLLIPNLITETISYPDALLPDSEVILSPSVAGFDVEGFIDSAGGFLSQYEDTVDEETLSGAQVVQRVALETSTNPRLLLAFLEFQSGWVYGQPAPSSDLEHPLGFYVDGYRGLYKELSLAAKQINIPYYAWRQGTLTEIRFPEYSGSYRLAPQLNPGSIALQYLFSRFYKEDRWRQILYNPGEFLKLYTVMYGDPWERAASVEPLFPPGLEQPSFELPFLPGQAWSLTGGPHLSWNTGTPRGALDFAPVTGERPCKVSIAWATSTSSGVIAHADHNAVVLDMDGDGFEGTGWTVLYYHISESEHIVPGTWVETDTDLGHPSCEGGRTTGTHVHIARRYNGEWLPAGYPLPWTLSGWQVVPGEKSYEGYLVKGDSIVTASPSGKRSSLIMR